MKERRLAVPMGHGMGLGIALGAASLIARAAENGNETARRSQKALLDIMERDDAPPALPDEGWTEPPLSEDDKHHLNVAELKRLRKLERNKRVNGGK